MGVTRILSFKLRCTRLVNKVFLEAFSSVVLTFKDFHKLLILLCAEGVLIFRVNNMLRISFREDPGFLAISH